MVKGYRKILLTVSLAVHSILILLCLFIIMYPTQLANTVSEIYYPLTKLDNTYNKNTGNKLYGKFEFQYDVIKNLKLSTRFGYTKYDGNSKSFNPLVFYGNNNV